VPSEIATAFPFCLGFVPLTKRLSAQSPNAVSLHDRIMTPSKIGPERTTLYPNFLQKRFDPDYGAYVPEILGPSDDQRSLDQTITLHVSSVQELAI
jgi:hypothetical protein